jgi:hypothetical protein
MIFSKGNGIWRAKIDNESVIWEQLDEHLKKWMIAVSKLEKSEINPH